MDPKISQLHFYSLAIVANNKLLSSKLIEATPIEHLSLIDGEIASIPLERETKGKDSEGNEYTVKVTTDNAIQAKWLPFSGSNRKTAPDVRRGERVIIWQFADYNDFYWSTTGFDDHLRKLETATYAFSGTKDEEVDGTEPENSYTFEVSTHLGLVTLSTSKVNGEHCKYFFQFNAKEGRVILTDDIGNEFLLDSALTKIFLKNVDGTTVVLDKKRLMAFANDQISIKATNLISLSTKDLKIETTTTDIKGKTTFQDEVEFKKTVKANGITSTAPIEGPSNTI